MLPVEFRAVELTIAHVAVVVPAELGVEEDRYVLDNACIVRVPMLLPDRLPISDSLQFLLRIGQIHDLILLSYVVLGLVL